LTLLLAGCISRALLQPPVPTPNPGAAAKAAAPLSPSPVASPVQSRVLREDQPVHVEARRLRYNHRLQQTHFLGPVTVTQDSTELCADELLAESGNRQAQAWGHVRVRDTARQVLLYSDCASYTDSLHEAELHDAVRLVSVDPSGHSVSITADSAYYHGLSRTARLQGDVRLLTRDDLSATAQTADFDETRGVADLQGGAWAGKGRNRFRADEIQIETKAHGVGVTLTGHVKACFIPEEVETLSKER
jgi:lipopolysaccharide transport protein LptA